MIQILKIAFFKKSNVIAGLLFLCRVSFASSDLNIQECLRGLNRGDVETRRAAIKSFNNQLAKDEGKNFSDELLPVLLKATTDPDVEVRVQGFGSLNLISHVIVWEKPNSNSQAKRAAPTIEFADEPRLRAAILRGFTDPNPEIRKFAISALSMGYPPSQETEAILLDRWDQESSHANQNPQDDLHSHDVKEALLNGLGAGHYHSPRTVKALTQMLSDKDDEIKGWAAYFISDVKAPEALRILVNGASSSDAFVRQQFIEAIGKYGSMARQYLPQLEALRSTTNDLATKQIIEKCIDDLNK